MGLYREKLDGHGIVCRRRQWVKWAKRQGNKWMRLAWKRYGEDASKKLPQKGWEA